MKYAIYSVLILTLALGFSACSSKDEVISIDRPSGVTVETLQQQLIGTSWMIGDYHVSFKDNNKAIVKGEPIHDLYPDGVEATYSLKENGDFVINAKKENLDETKIGIWNGKELVVDNRKGQLLQ